MFLFSVTRQGVPRAVDAPSVREFPVGRWVVTVATDGWLSSCAAGPGKVGVQECAPSRPDILLAEASFDGATQAVELCKTLVGGRQVYYHLGPRGELHCASHARLLKSAGVPLEDDPQCLPEFFLYRYVTPPRTLFRNVSQLLAGQRLRFEYDANADAWRLAADEQYVPPEADANGDTGPGADRLYGRSGERNATALRGAVASLATLPHAPDVLLSGGLDSSILFKLAREELGVSDSHSTSYPFASQREAEDLEQHYALSAAEVLGARHRFFLPTVGQYVRGVVESIAIAEEPVVHLQSVLMMLLFRDGLPAGRGSVVVGQGADGAYGLQLHGKVRRLEGRARRYEPWRKVLTMSPALGALRVASKTVGRASGLVEAMDRRWRPDDLVDDPRHVLWWLGVTGDPAWVRRKFHATPEDANRNRAAVMRPYQGRGANDLISLLDFLGDVSVTQSVWSKLGEASGKWVYYPFNDRRVLDAAFETPWDAKLAEPKGVLRGVARRVGVPEFIVSRPKANFNARPRAWACPGGVLDPLLPLAAKLYGEKELRSAQADDWPSAYTFWNMLSYAIWRRLFIDGESQGALLEELERSTLGPDPALVVAAVA